MDNSILFYARDDCVPCPSQAPSCDTCPSGYTCALTGRSCAACPAVTCTPQQDTTVVSSKGVSGGAIAGGVIGSLALVAIIVALIFWYRRKNSSANTTTAAPQQEVKRDVPARAEAVLSRPDPVEKPKSPEPTTPAALQRNASSYRTYADDNATINLDPDADAAYPSQSAPRSRASGSAHSDPFRDRDGESIMSATTQSTNVIPIALVPHGTVSSGSPLSSPSMSTGGAPIPPAPHDPLSGSPLNLEHVNISYDSFRPPHVPYAASTASGLSKRESVLTTGSFASDVLYEAPQILTTTTSARPVLGVAKPEVISLRPGTTGQATPSMRSAVTSRGPGTAALAGRSPLAQSSFGPGDVISDTDSEVQEIVYHTHNPFGDEHISERGSMSTFGGYGGVAASPMPLPSTASPHQSTYKEAYHAKKSPVPIRPASTFTQAGSIIDAEIAGATLVRMDSVKSANSMTSEHRLTSAHLVTPTPMRREADHVLQQQQAKALAAARARAAAVAAGSGLPLPGVNRRTSAASDASAGGDSLLENFTFVPPSPISSLPPRSPLSVNGNGVNHSSAPSPTSSTSTSVTGSGSSSSGSSRTDDDLTPMTTASTYHGESVRVDAPLGVGRMSTASGTSALEGYTFRIDSGDEQPLQQQQQQSMIKQQQQQRYPPSSMKNANNNRINNSTTANNVGGRAGNGNANGNGNGNSLGAKKQRASLDTLALTADLSAFPLNWGDAPMPPAPSSRV